MVSGFVLLVSAKADRCKVSTKPQKEEMKETDDMKAEAAGKGQSFGHLCYLARPQFPSHNQDH